MENKVYATVLFITWLAVSCVPLTTSIPSGNFPTSTLITSVSENTSSVLPSQMVKTQILTLIEPYQDVRSEDLQEFENLGEPLIKTLWFDQSTLWSTPDQQIAQNILSGYESRAWHS